MDHEKRKSLVQFYWGIVLILVIVAILYWLLIWRYFEYTNDAYVEGNQVYINAQRSGFVTAIHTDDTFLVNKGQLLIELDATDSIIALEQAKKELAAIVREVCQAIHQVFAYQAELGVRQAELIRSEQDFKHREDVISAAGVSLEDFEHATAQLKVAQYNLKMTEALYEKAFALVQGTTIQNHPLVQVAAEKVRNAWVQLYRCNIYSPVEGIAAQRKIQVGMWVNPGEPLLSVIPLDQIWLNANFKETQLTKMKIGQSVNIHSDLYGEDVTYHGKVVGLPGAAGNAFSLLPPQNLSGNWIKIVQRLPVRVQLDPEEIKKYPLRIGLSMEATVDLSDQDGLLVPTTSKGSPTYATNIYDDEEKGVTSIISRIIYDNTDPQLLPFIDKELEVKSEAGSQKPEVRSQKPEDRN